MESWRIYHLNRAEKHELMKQLILNLSKTLGLKSMQPQILDSATLNLLNTYIAELYKLENFQPRGIQETIYIVLNDLDILNLFNPKLKQQIPDLLKEIILKTLDKIPVESITHKSG